MRMALIGRYFSAFAPDTLDDCAAFTGYGKREIVRLLEKSGLPLKSVQCDDITYYHLHELSGDGKIPSCLFLAGFDQLFMGCMDRGRMMDERDKRNVITNSGIVFPTILLNGRMKARWKKEGATVTVTPFQTLTIKQKEAVRKSAKKLFSDAKVDVVFAE